MTLHELEIKLRGLEDIYDNVDLYRFKMREQFRKFLDEEGKFNGKSMRENMAEFDKAMVFSKACQDDILLYEEELNKLRETLQAEDGLSNWFVDKILEDYGVYNRFYDKDRPV